MQKRSIDIYANTVSGMNARTSITFAFTIAFHNARAMKLKFAVFSFNVCDSFASTVRRGKLLKRSRKF